MIDVQVGKYGIQKQEWDDKDPRGILWVWEEPRPGATYIIGCDPTVGINGWERELRTQDDVRTDNAAIEVIRRGRNGSPDVQVAEWAAPINSIDLAAVVNFIGQLYKGNNEDGQALAAIEVYPGPGWATQRELINRFGYTNLPPWLLEDSLAPKMTKKVGWYSTKSTRRDLWIRGVRHITTGNIVIHSPWLVEEMVRCVQDNFLTSASRASYGAHDDRVVALLIAIWYANEWGFDFNPPESSKLVENVTGDYQNTAVSLNEMYSRWDEQFSDMIDE